MLPVVGIDDDVNLYAYVGNDPLNKVDPSGTDALWMDDQSNGASLLMIPVHFGTGVPAYLAKTHPNFVADVVSRAGSLSIGDKNVKLAVVPTNRPSFGVMNKLSLGRGGNTFLCGSAGTCVDRLGGNRGYVDIDKSDAVDAAVHEIMHFAGIDDQYMEGKDAMGNRSTTAKPGQTAANIMVSTKGTSLSARQMQEAKSNQSTKQCVVSTGSRIPSCK